MHMSHNNTTCLIIADSTLDFSNIVHVLNCCVCESLQGLCVCLSEYLCYVMYMYHYGRAISFNY